MSLRRLGQHLERFNTLLRLYLERVILSKENLLSTPLTSFCEPRPFLKHNNMCKKMYIKIYILKCIKRERGAKGTEIKRLTCAPPTGQTVVFRPLLRHASNRLNRLTIVFSPMYRLMWSSIVPHTLDSMGLTGL